MALWWALREGAQSADISVDGFLRHEYACGLVAYETRSTSFLSQTIWERFRPSVDHKGHVENNRFSHEIDRVIETQRHLNDLQSCAARSAHAR